MLTRQLPNASDGTVCVQHWQPTGVGVAASFVSRGFQASMPHQRDTDGRSTEAAASPAYSSHVGSAVRIMKARGFVS